MAKNLAHKTIVDDSSRCSVASADYLLVFRRDGKNPVPIAHPVGLLEYAGERSIRRAAALPRLDGEADREPLLALDLAAVRVGLLG
jgi:hypothetical protein